MTLGQQKLFVQGVLTKMIAAFSVNLAKLQLFLLEDPRTVIALWHTTICLLEVITELRKKKIPKRCIIHHQDNASLLSLANYVLFEA